MVRRSKKTTPKKVAAGKDNEEKIKHSAKIEDADKSKLTKAAEDLMLHYGDVRGSWSQALPDQKEQFLVHSPLLSTLLSFFSEFQK